MAKTKKKNLQVDSNSSSSYSSEKEHSKHADDGSKLKRPRSKANLSPPPMKKPVKRPTKATADKDPKKSKTPGEEERNWKSVLFQRLWSEEEEVRSWSEEEEIALMQGMLDYKNQKGSDPMEDSNDFLEFLKSSTIQGALDSTLDLSSAIQGALDSTLDLACEEIQMIIAALRSVSGGL